MLWTLLILVACFTPAVEIPKVDIPLIDKWTHMVMFGVFSFLWLCARPYLTAAWIISLCVISIAFGALIEYLQGALTFLGRSAEFMDAVADGLGGLIGIALFCVVAWLVGKRMTR